MKRRKLSASSWGKPSNLTMTRTGMCRAYSMAASKLARPSVSVEQFAAQGPGERLEGGDRPGPEGGQQHPAGHGWKGGSEVIGGDSPIGAGRSSGPGRSSLTTTEREVKCSVS